MDRPEAVKLKLELGMVHGYIDILNYQRVLTFGNHGISHTSSAIKRGGKL
jgi:hypothetical protein